MDDPVSRAFTTAGREAPLILLDPGVPARGTDEGVPARPGSDTYEVASPDGVPLSAYIMGLSTPVPAPVFGRAVVTESWLL